MKSLLKALLCASAFLSLAPMAAQAQEWPSRPVRIVVPYPAGTGPDIMARMLADKLAKRTSQTFVVDNKPGANAIIGTDNVAKSPPDGSTLLLVDRLTLSVNPLLYKPLPYDPRKDLTSVSNVADVKLYLMVAGNFPANNFHEFVAYAKANPGKVAYGTGGAGSILHLNLEAIQAGTGIEMLHVPYKAFAEVVPALLGGQVQTTTGGIEAVQKLVEDKRIKLLAIGSATRAAVAPSIPTIREAGGTDDMLLSTAYTLHARADTPAAVVQKISQEVTAAIADPDVQASTKARGLEAYGTTPAVLDAQLDRDAAAIGKLVRERNIKVQ
jgi:tripartite-type tricarboxylate transporter receptor subunit TctC